MKTEVNIQELTSGILQGKKAALSRTITLLESTRIDHRETARKILDQCSPAKKISVRIGITGTPGVGKSTFIEALGKYFLNEKHTLAILAIDPSSKQSKGSILGDKTRMETLAANPNVYIRPTPAGDTLGGVGLHTRETILLCEAAGFDTIFVETVGVGQSETAVQSITDMLLLLMLPGSGDELQGIKRGIMEMADLIVINKTDENTAKKIEQTVSGYKNALRLTSSHSNKQKADILTCSALENKGIREIVAYIQHFIVAQKEQALFDKKRAEQHAHWLEESIHELLLDRFYMQPEIQQYRKVLEEEVIQGKITAHQAAQKLIDKWNSL